MLGNKYDEYDGRWRYLTPDKQGRLINDVNKKTFQKAIRGVAKGKKKNIAVFW